MLNGGFPKRVPEVLMKLILLDKSLCMSQFTGDFKRVLVVAAFRIVITKVDCVCVTFTDRGGGLKF